jgi:hypothetical protein
VPVAWVGPTIRRQLIMDISKLTIGEAREIAALFGKASSCTSTVSHPFEVGENYFIRTVTHHFTGKLVEVYPGELILEKAAWIADDGRFAEAVSKGAFSEVEPFPEDARVIVNRASLVDAVKIGFKLPVSQK